MIEISYLVVRDPSSRLFHIPAINQTPTISHGTRQTKATDNIKNSKFVNDTNMAFKGVIFSARSIFECLYAMQTRAQSFPTHHNVQLSTWQRIQGKPFRARTGLLLQLSIFSDVKDNSLIIFFVGGLIVPLTHTSSQRSKNK